MNDFSAENGYLTAPCPEWPTGWSSEYDQVTSSLCRKTCDALTDSEWGFLIHKLTPDRCAMAGWKWHFAHLSNFVFYSDDPPMLPVVSHWLSLAQWDSQLPFATRHFLTAHFNTAIGSWLKRHGHVPIGHVVGMTYWLRSLALIEVVWDEIASDKFWEAFRRVLEWGRPHGIDILDLYFGVGPQRPELEHGYYELGWAYGLVANHASLPTGGFPGVEKRFNSSNEKLLLFRDIAKLSGFQLWRPGGL